MESPRKVFSSESRNTQPLKIDSQASLIRYRSRFRLSERVSSAMRKGGDRVSGGVYGPDGVLHPPQVIRIRSLVPGAGIEPALPLPGKGF